jgi:hypothetical protein
VIISTVFSNTPKLNAGIARASRALGKDVVNIHYDLGFDAMGFPSIFFKIVLADAASRQPKIREVAQRTALALMKHTQTEEHGVHAYFNFRSQSEVKRMSDPAWA